MTNGGLIAIVAGVLGAIGAVGSVLATPMMVWPPVLAAIVVLTGAALAVDYFGAFRRRDGFSGLDLDPRRAWARATVLSRRFERQRRRSSPQTGWTARALLMALARADRLKEAGAAVDFLAVDAITARVGADVAADAVRAVALAELGRFDESDRIMGALRQDRFRGHLPIVGYAEARCLQRRGQLRKALDAVERALAGPRAPEAISRELRFLRGRLLALLGKGEAAVACFDALHREGLSEELARVATRATERGEAAVAMAIRQATGDAAPYR